MKRQHCACHEGHSRPQDDTRVRCVSHKTQLFIWQFRRSIKIQQNFYLFFLIGWNIKRWAKAAHFTSTGGVLPIHHMPAWRLAVCFRPYGGRKGIHASCGKHRASKEQGKETKSSKTLRCFSQPSNTPVLESLFFVSRLLQWIVFAFAHHLMTSLLKGMLIIFLLLTSCTSQFIHFEPYQKKKKEHEKMHQNVQETYDMHLYVLLHHTYASVSTKKAIAFTLPIKATLLIKLYIDCCNDPI